MKTGGHMNVMRVMMLVHVFTLCSRPSRSPRNATVCPASVAVATAVSWVLVVKVGVAGSDTVLAMGLGVCSPPQGYSESESWHRKQQL